MFLNAPPITTGAENKRRSSQQQQHYAGTLINGRFTKQRRLKGFTNVKNSYGVPIDVNNDGEMELITWNTLRVHRVTGYFTLTDISSHVLPREINFRAVVSVAEFDYDNDGHMDLYVARSVTNDISWMVEQVGREPSDILLRNVGGRFMDMTSLAGIPPGGESRGVTTGDFDNDGYADILVTQYKGRDWLLMNNGDGSFRREVSLGYKKSDVTRGDQPTAVDYDRDGWIDVVLSEGSFTDRKHGGYTRVMRNVLGNSVGSDRTWLLVSVGAAPDGKTSSMHAVVRVRTGSGLDMIRRVGAAGTVSGVSFIEEVHFGLGSFEGVATVAVRWRDGSRTTVFSKGNRMLKVGVFG